MPAEDSPALLVARFLKANNYEKTLDAFITEANLPPDAGSLPTTTALTLETVLDEKKTFDKSLKYSKEGELDGPNSGWTQVVPSTPHNVTSLPSSANLLHVSVDGAVTDDAAGRPLIIASSADRKVSMLSTEAGREHLGSLPPTPLDSPVLSCLFLDDETTVTTTMSGLVCMYNLRTRQRSERRDHKKYVVRAAAAARRDGDGWWVATAGWDGRVLLYGASAAGELGRPLAEVSLATNPETVLFARDPDTERLFLLVSRRDSSSIFYHLLKPPAAASSTEPSLSTEQTTPLLTPAGSQNLAPHSNAWVAFSPSAMSICPTDAGLLAVATSSLPHMKVILVRLLFPRAAVGRGEEAAPVYETQAAMARASLARQDREEAAIAVHVSTMAPQTPYSTPQVAWRPDGSGVWVNGDDGAIRGIEAKTGRVRAVLADGHEAGSKIRSIWAGYVRGEEWLVSGGFDRRLVVWTPEGPKT